VGVFIAAGSRDEDASNSGVSHLIQQLAFKVGSPDVSTAAHTTNQPTNQFTPPYLI
jgi:predicted Zn-dependent peptidase